MPPAPQATPAPDSRTRLICTVLLAVILLVAGVPLLLEYHSAINETLNPTKRPQSRSRPSLGMQTVGMVRTYILDYGVPPTSLDNLVPKYSDKIPCDAWGKPFTLTNSTDGTFLITTLGADRAPGGTGPDTDEWWRISGASTTKGTGTPPSHK